MDPTTAITVVLTSMVVTPAVIVGQVLRHREKMTALRNRQEGAPGVIEEVGALRREVAALRDTTTRFDMSFDAALHRVEQRLDSVEQGQVVVPETHPTHTYNNGSVEAAVPRRSG